MASTLLMLGLTGPLLAQHIRQPNPMCQEGPHKVCLPRGKPPLHSQEEGDEKGP